MEYENPILLFDWENDIQNTPAPRRAVFDLRAARIDDDGFPRGIDYEPFLMVQADPLDAITIVGENNVKKCVHMNPALWMRTLDEYINQYFRLSELLAAEQNDPEWIEILLHDDVIDKLRNQKKEVKKKRKLLDVDIDYLKFVRPNALKDIGGGWYQTPKYGAPVYLNCLYRDLCTPANATKQKLELEYDGKKYIEGDWIPNFSLIDYYWHEAITGISLSIEITAILLEVQNKMPAKALWEKAFDEFREKALPIIVKSKMFFTRNTLARNFFQQIYLEQTLRSYDWKGNRGDDWDDESYWKGLIEHALMPFGLLKCYPYEPDIPEMELENSLAHLWKLLSYVKMPINFADYIARPTNGLVLFCNPAHENVSRFLNELGSGVNTGETVGIKPWERRVFTKVHSAVKTAMKD